MPDALYALSARAMSEGLDRGDFSSRELTDAHLARIATVDPKVRAFTTVFAERARDEADRSDQERAEGHRRGPLHGLPVSVKECFDLEGQATTLGIPAWRDRRAPRDAAMVQALRQAGAVILGRTNLSQTMLFAESRNPIYGETVNPFSSKHSPGGSSGGEGAAVAAGMSPLGIGTDIGGSIRTPASFTGIVGFKPTLDRLPTTGQATVLEGQEAVRSMCGPLARSVADIDLFFRAFDPAALNALDAKVPPLAWKGISDIDVSKLRVGYYAEDGVIPVSRSIARGVERARGAAASAGCVTVAFTPPNVPGLVRTYLDAVSSDGGQTLVAALEGGEVDPSLRALFRLVELRPGLRKALATAVTVAGQDRMAMMLDAIGEKPVARYWKLVAELRKYRSRLLDAMHEASIDVLLCPAYATPALPLGMSKNFTLGSSPAMLFNAVQFPAGVVPVTTVRHDETRRSGARDLLERHAAKIDAASFGLPVGVQVVARPWKDELALAVMSAIEASVSRDADCPRTPVDPK